MPASPPEKLVIIGSGPAAWTAAIYAGRAKLHPLVYEGAMTQENQLRGTAPLGQLNLTTEVENFPGFPGGIPGPDLMLRMREQALEDKVGARVVTEDVFDVDLSRRPFALTDSAGGTVHCHALILATGASANYLGLASEDRFKNAGVSACAVCDGAQRRFRDKPLVVVGGGDTACEEGVYLTKFASTVHVVYRKDRAAMRASPIMQDRLLTQAKIKPVWWTAVEEVLGNGKDGVTGVRVKNVKTGDEHEIPAAGVFLAIGHTPNTAFLRGQVKTNPQGYVELADPWRATTSVEGVFAAGDVADYTYRQAITAAGMGCKAALDAERWLSAKGIH